jgi:eukaryotic-like serine/threonine-protein kinase
VIPVVATAEHGIHLLAEHGYSRRELAELSAAAHEIARGFAGWQPAEEKSAVWQAQDQVEEAKRRAGSTAGEALAVLMAALADPAQRDEARRGLADYFYARFLQAERVRDIEAREQYRALTQAFHDGRFDNELEGKGKLSIASDPGGADVTLYRFVERGFGLVGEHYADLGRTPVGPVELPKGSYLAVLRREGSPDVQYPVLVERSGAWSGTVHLYAESDIPPGLKYVPAGPYVQGGDPETRGWALPLDRPVIDDFFIAEFPVTTAEYVEFLEDLARTDPQLAQQRAPRVYPDRGHYFTLGADGRFTPPPPGPDGQQWHSRLPVVGVNWHDAMAYVQWRSARDGWAYTLPSERQWEKAARGVDGRWYPWGDRFDPSLCNMRDSRREGPGPVTVDEFPTDCSVYGVRGMAGNVRDWTSTVVSEELGDVELPSISYMKWQQASDTRVLRGGAWSPLVPRLADRYWVQPDLVLSFIGFRLAYNPPPR